MGELLTGSLMQYSVSESRKTWDAVNTCNQKVLRDLKERLIVVFIKYGENLVDRGDVKLELLRASS
jgi:hypothetical protein